MNTKAILLVSVGTSQTKALEKTTLCLKEEIEKKYNRKCCTNSILQIKTLIIKIFLLTKQKQSYILC